MLHCGSLIQHRNFVVHRSARVDTGRYQPDACLEAVVCCRAPRKSWTTWALSPSSQTVRCFVCSPRVNITVLNAELYQPAVTRRVLAHHYLGDTEDDGPWHRQL